MAGRLDGAKRAAATLAVERYVRAGQHLALGTGTTAAAAVRALAALPFAPSLDCVASSEETERLARSLGVPVRAVRGEDRFELMIDGADEIGPGLELTKGGGGALLREKLLARLSSRLVIVADASKLVRRLGERAPIPLEVVPFCRPVLLRQLAAERLGPELRAGGGGEPFRTDNGNELIDLRPARPIERPAELDRQLRSYVGVVETGLFLGLAERALIGTLDGKVEEMLAPAGASARPARL